jgi:BirA family biotin operon repressor/biotin-[acetyl-CoA-carboxylase] ligase
MGLNTLFVGHTVINLDKVDSTNNYIHELLRKSPQAEGFTVCAREQYAGKGQRGNSWLSQPRANLTFSILFQPKFLAASEQFWLTKALALGVAETVFPLVPHASVKIKWPNDIYVDDRKIAGILVENILESSGIKYSIAGIGLNVNQDSFDPVLTNAISLKLLTGKSFDLAVCLQNICVSIEKFYLKLRDSHHKELDGLYHKLLYKRGILSRFSIKGVPFEGTIKEVSAQGHLLIDTKNGTEAISNDIMEVSDVKHLIFL